MDQKDTRRRICTVAACWTLLKASLPYIPGWLSRQTLLSLTTAALALGYSSIASAQTTSGNAATGATLFTSNGCSGCHTPTATDNRINAANASGVITNAMNNDGITGMGYLLATVSVADRNDIAAYLATFISPFSTQTVVYNTAKDISINKNIVLNSTVGSFTSLAAGSTAPTKGTLSFNNAVSPPIITYTPTTGQTGADTFTFVANGPAGTSSERTININIALPAVPSVSATTVTVPNAAATPINLNSQITSAAPITAVTVSTAPAHGTTSVSGTTVTYTPAAGYQGTDSFAYTATNITGTSTPATVTITVSPVPTINTTLNTAATIDLQNFSSSSFTGVTIATAPRYGTVSVNGTRVTYTPNRNFFGTDSFVYQAFGSGGYSPTGTVSVNVTGRTDPTQETNVINMIGAQIDSANRFGRTQLSNIQSHLESLHSRRANSTNGTNRFAWRTNPAQTPSTQGDTLVAPRSAPLINNNWQPAKALNATQQNSATLPMDLLASTGKSIANGDASQNIQSGLNALGISGVNRTSLNLNAVATSTGLTTGNPAGYGIWIAGNIRFGTRTGEPSLSHFLTDGVTVGVDTPLTENLIVGLGVGYARDRSTLNEDGSQSNMNGSSVALYASYSPIPNTFVDGALGYGVLNYAGTRYVSPIGQFTQLSRRGEQLFGSLSSGYEFRNEGLLLSPYGRFDFSYSRLNATTESGGGLYALRYGEQTAQTAQVSLGLRAEATHQADIGTLLPHLRIEYQHALDNRGQTVIQYADQLGSTGYRLGSSSNNRKSVVLGLGSDLILRDGLRLSVDYQTLRSLGGENSQAIALRVSKEFGETASQIRGSRYDEFRIPSLGISIDGGYTFDDNVSRAEKSNDKFHDESFSVNLRKSWNLQITSNTRAVAQAFFGGEKFHKYIGLSHLTLGGQTELQYRTSGEFAAPTFGVFARLAAEDYQSEMRDGYRWSTGLTYRQPVTDRVSLFSALSYNKRNATQRVFDTEDMSARINLDYKLARNSSLYFTGEYRIGDMTSSGSGLLQYLDMSRAFARDDVFVTPQLFTYRFRGKTMLTTVGYSLPLGPTDALDFSWRRVYSAPDWQPSYISNHIHYIDNQYSMSYLTRF